MSEASELETGSYFLQNGEPVKVLRREVVAVGTHSHTKLKIFYQGIMEKGERVSNFSHTDKVEIVDIVRKMGQVISKVNGKVQIMDAVSYETLDAEALTLYNELNEGDNVTFIEFAGKIHILSKR